nr:DNA polymerase III subunit gamma and tau [Nocardioides aequoreus]
MEPSLALYRRYRPETFAEVIGQDHVTAPLRAALAANRVNHAYLFSGPRGCGKTTSARILARALNCEQAPVADPCGECQSCRDLARGGSGSVDVIEIDAASHGGVDDARDLRERAFFAPVSSRYKVYIIDEAHMVSSQGFNALLKLVEEPPEHLKFIFATTEPEKVIATIRSRTHHYPFRLIPPRVLSDHLAELCEREGVSIDPAALPLVVRAGAGSARDSLSVLDQLLGGAGPDGVTYEVATGLLGYTPDNLLDEVVDAFAAHDGAGVFGVVDKVIETGQDPRRFTEDVLRRLRDLVIVSAVPGAHASGLVDAPEEQAERLVAQAARFGRAGLVRAADIVAAGLTEMRGATTPRLLLELLCARVLLPAAEAGELGFQARLERVERRLEVAGPESEQPSAGAVARTRAAAAPPGPVPRPAADEVAVATSPPSAPDAVRERPAPERTEPTTERAPAQSGEPAVSAKQAPTQPSRPAPQQSAPQQPVPERSAPQEVVPPQSSPEPAPSGEPGRLGLAEVRRLWPDLLEKVKTMRRFTWILLSQNAQVLAVDDSTLTVGFKTSGARESFVGGGSEEVLRQAAIEVVGADWRIETAVDPSSEGSRGPAGRAPEPPVPDPGPAPTAPARPAAAEQARASLAASAAQESSPPPDLDADAHPDDPTSADDGLDSAELLARELGATVIDETPRS